ncbi:MAG TPA: type II toxin-antitoxin system RelE/ParE family toxin [Lentisphaeria bacterium]|nr:type II toxin-antitoxin system RelE/ParE family toxin [Lentisphaeria bacterium]
MTLSFQKLYFEHIYPGLGLDLEREIKEDVFKIAENPEIWSLRDDGTRRFSTKRFPYQIVYSIHEDFIWIIAIAHHKRFPEYWKERL